MNGFQSTDHTVNTAHSVYQSGQQNYVHEEDGRLSPSPFGPVTSGSFFISDNAVHTSTFNVQEGPLKCPKCQKIFAPGANDWSVKSHLEGKGCPGMFQRCLATVFMALTLIPGLPPSTQGRPISHQLPSALTSPVPVPSPSVIIQCPGLSLSWDSGSDGFWSTYPFHVHHPESKYNPGYHILSLYPPQIRSGKCLGTSRTSGTPCAWCASVSFDVEALRDRASLSFSDVRVEERLSHAQLKEKVAELKEQVNKLKLEVIAAQSNPSIVSDTRRGRQLP